MDFCCKMRLCIRNSMKFVWYVYLRNEFDFGRFMESWILRVSCKVIGSGSGFKASQKTGRQLKVSSDRLEEAGNRTCDPWFTRHRFIQYTTNFVNFSPENSHFIWEQNSQKEICIRNLRTCTVVHFQDWGPIRHEWVDRF